MALAVALAAAAAAIAAAAGGDDGNNDDDDNDLPLFSSLSCPPGSEGLELSISARPPSHRTQGRQILYGGPAAFIQARQKAGRPAHKKEVLVSLGSRNGSGVRLPGNCFPVLDQHRGRPCAEWAPHLLGSGDCVWRGLRFKTVKDLSKQALEGTKGRKQQAYCVQPPVSIFCQC